MTLLKSVILESVKIKSVKVVDTLSHILASSPKLHFFPGFITLLTGLILDNVVWAIVKNEMVKL